MDNESGAAFTFVMIVIMVVVIAIVWAFLAVGINPIIYIHNGYVAQGQVSVQSHQLSIWSLALLLGIPGIGLGGMLILAISRANEVAQAGNFW